VPSLLVNLSSGQTLTFPFEQWEEWASIIESSEARGFTLQNGATASRFLPPRKFRHCNVKVEPMKKGDEFKGVRVRYFAGSVVYTITLYLSGIAVSGIERLGRRVGP